MGETMSNLFSTGLRRIVLTGLVATILAAAIGGVSLARAGGSTSDQRLVLKQVDAGAAFVNISHSTGAPKPGDGFIFRAKLFRNGMRVGWLNVVCTQLIGTQDQCQGTFTLPGGTLVGSALTSTMNNESVTHIAITGGTGRYDQASGQAWSTNTSEHTARVVIDLDH